MSDDGRVLLVLFAVLLFKLLTKKDPGVPAGAGPGPGISPGTGPVPKITPRIGYFKLGDFYDPNRPPP